MTDKEIIQAFAKCCESDCDNDVCKKTGWACTYLYRKVFDVIERLKVKNDIYSKQLTDAWNRIEELDRLNETARNEAIKEFTERLVAEKYYTGNKIGYGTYAVMVDDINKIAEKMIGDNK